MISLDRALWILFLIVFIVDGITWFILNVVQ